MAQPVLALGAALLTVSGSVWYVPALADLRAGADRPRSRRDAAAACVSGWGTAGTIAVLLLVTGTWTVLALTAAAGTAVTLGLRTRAAVRRRREAEEAARHWAQLRSGSAAVEDRPRNGRTAFAVLAGSGLAVGVTTAVLLLTGGVTGGPYPWLTAAVPAALVGLFLLIAATLTDTPAHARTGPRDVRSRTG
ncbi:hypothetical protein ACH4S8_22630 [Streptomyces sp. NPDC021080]|uniref:hypothetical protein n=1 Tax=Streptomyces sp. NPDC021080 TaxID=3365110 RepID=UPI0037B8A591